LEKTTEVRIMSKEEAAARLLQHLGKRFIRVNRKRANEEREKYLTGVCRGGE
jgi:hypothetical protein